MSRALILEGSSREPIVLYRIHRSHNSSIWAYILPWFLCRFWYSTVWINFIAMSWEAAGKHMHDIKREKGKKKKKAAFISLQRFLLFYWSSVIKSIWINIIHADKPNFVSDFCYICEKALPRSRSLKAWSFGIYSARLGQRAGPMALKIPGDWSQRFSYIIGPYQAYAFRTDGLHGGTSLLADTAHLPVSSNLLVSKNLVCIVKRGFDFILQYNGNGFLTEFLLLLLFSIRRVMF